MLLSVAWKCRQNETTKMGRTSDSLDTYRIRGEIIFRSYKEFIKIFVVCISVAMEQLGKHIIAKKNSRPTISKGISIARQWICKQPSAGCVTTISDVYY
jgi:hypothetical protein